jgi:hypothetical protein
MPMPKILKIFRVLIPLLSVILGWPLAKGLCLFETLSDTVLLGCGHNIWFGYLIGVLLIFSFFHLLDFWMTRKTKGFG